MKLNQATVLTIFFTMCKRVCTDFRMKEYDFAHLAPNLLVRNTFFYHKTHLGWNF